MIQTKYSVLAYDLQWKRMRSNYGRIYKYRKLNTKKIKRFKKSITSDVIDNLDK